MGMRILDGRDFSDEDSRREKPMKVIVNEAFAQKLFPCDNPIGRVFGNDDAGATYVIVAPFLPAPPLLVPAPTSVAYLAHLCLRLK